MQYLLFHQILSHNHRWSIYHRYANEDEKVANNIVSRFIWKVLLTRYSSSSCRIQSFVPWVATAVFLRSSPCFCNPRHFSHTLCNRPLYRRLVKGEVQKNCFHFWNRNDDFRSLLLYVTQTTLTHLICHANNLNTFTIDFISVHYQVMLIRQSNDHILKRCYTMFPWIGPSILTSSIANNKRYCWVYSIDSLSTIDFTFEMTLLNTFFLYYIMHSFLTM